MYDIAIAVRVMHDGGAERSQADQVSRACCAQDVLREADRTRVEDAGRDAMESNRTTFYWPQAQRTGTAMANARSRNTEAVNEPETICSVCCRSV